MSQQAQSNANVVALVFAFKTEGRTDELSTPKAPGVQYHDITTPPPPPVRPPARDIFSNGPGDRRTDRPLASYPGNSCRKEMMYLIFVLGISREGFARSQEFFVWGKSEQGFDRFLGFHSCTCVFLRRTVPMKGVPLEHVRTHSYSWSLMGSPKAFVFNKHRDPILTCAIVSHNQTLLS